MGTQTFINYGLQTLMGPQTFMNYGLQIVMGPYLLWFMDCKYEWVHTLLRIKNFGLKILMGLQLMIYGLQISMSSLTFINYGGPNINGSTNFLWILGSEYWLLGPKIYELWAENINRSANFYELWAANVNWSGIFCDLCAANINGSQTFYKLLAQNINGSANFHQLWTPQTCRIYGLQI